MEHDNSLKTLLMYFLTGLFSLILVLFIFRIFGIEIGIPLNYTGDGLVHYNFAKNIKDSGWWSTNPKLGAPLQQELYDFPLSENLNLVILKILTLLGFNWIMSVNIFYILTFALTALIGLYVMKKMEISYSISISLSIIYAFLPYHFYRGVNHLFLSAYFVVPLAIYLSYKLASKNVESFWRIAALSILLGSIGAYYTFFSLIFISTGFIIGLIKNIKDKKFVFQGIAILTLIGFSLVLNIIPSIFYNYKYGKNLNAVSRHPKDTETYGLKITQLILPIEDHNLNLLNKIRKKYKIYGLPSLINENQYSSLGFISGLGFLGLLSWSLFGSKLNPLNKKISDKLNFLGTLNLMGLFWGTIGGFSLLISVYFTPVFRSINRISVFIGFISLLALGLVLQEVSKKHKKLIFVIAWIILPLGIYDQVSKGVMCNFINEPKNYFQLVNYAQKIEGKMDYAGKIYTLPFGQYPEGSDKRVIKISLLTNSLTWSVGAPKWRGANMWHYYVSKLPALEFLEKITENGFTGLMVYSPQVEEGKLTKLGKTIGIEPIIGPEGKFYFYDLREYIEKNDIQLNPENIYFHISGDCVNNYKEGVPDLLKYWCVNEGYVVLENISKITKEVLFKVTLETPEDSTQVSEKLLLKPGMTKINLAKYINTKEIFPKPYSETVWPPNLGYPNFIVHGIEIK